MMNDENKEEKPDTTRQGPETQVIGDCRCGHSIIYHLPLVGCMKCDCDEFH